MSNTPPPRTGKKTGMFIAVAAVLIILIAGLAYWYTQIKVPRDEAAERYSAAIAEYEEAAAVVATKNAVLTEKFEELEALVNSGQEPFDSVLLETSGAVIGQSQAEIVEIPALPATLETIKSASAKEIDEFAKELGAITASLGEVPSHESTIANIEQARVDLEASVALAKQLTAPSEQFVIKRLQGLKNISGVQAATEDHDPNGQLGKAGGYTSAVFFSSDLVDKKDIFRNGDIVEVGTEGGGSIETYATEQDAIKRDTYLSAFDGAPISSGSHVVLGTSVIRTSDNLTASQQKALETRIIESLMRMD